MAVGEFFTKIRDHKKGQHDSHSLDDIPSGPNRNKYERYAGEVVLLQQVARAAPTDLGFDQEIPPVLDDQLFGLERKLFGYIDQTLSNDAEMQTTALHIAPYLRKKDRDRLAVHAQTMDYQQAALITVREVLESSLDDSILDDCATINTLSALIYERFPTASSTEVVDILRRSYALSDWFTKSHGKYDPEIKKHMGRYDTEGNDTFRYDTRFYQLHEGPEGIFAEADTQQLEAVRAQLGLPVTDTLGCPASYSPLIHRLWDSTVEIYERTDSFRKMNGLQNFGQKEQ